MWPNEKSPMRSVSSSSTFSGPHQTVGSASHVTSPAATRIELGRSSRLLRACCERLHLGRLGCGAIGMLVGHVRLVVDALGVHGPDVVMGAVRGGLGGAH